MSILVSGGIVTEALNYNHVHMDILTILQNSQVDDLASPLYQVNLRYRLYSIDSNNNRKYESDVRSINIEDYIKLGTLKALAGEPELLNALQSVETAVGVVIQTLGDVGKVI